MTIRNYRVFALSCLLAAGLTISLPADAHAGEDHGDGAAAPLPVEAYAPRAYALSEDFELVVVLDDSRQPIRRLLATLDRFRTNEPVLAAKLEVEINGMTLAAKEVGPGIYAVDSPTLAKLPPGYELAFTVSIETPDTSDLLSASLHVPGPSSAEGANGRHWYEYVLWAMVILVFLVALAFLAHRRRQKKGIQ